MENFYGDNNTNRPFAIDLDGTFYTANEEVLAKNKSTLRQLRERGIEAFYCTGRTLTSALALLGDDVYTGYPGVYANGGLVYGARGQLLESKCFSKTMLSTFCKYLVAHGCESNAIFFGREGCFTLCDKPNLVKSVLFKHTITASPEIIDIEPLVKTSIFTIECLGIDISGVNLKPKVDYVAVDFTTFCQLIPPGVNKAQGLRVIAKDLQIDPKDIAFIGDGVNDIEAMRQSDYSYAVANACDDVKRCAKHVLTKTNDQGAFCEAVAELFQI